MDAVETRCTCGKVIWVTEGEVTTCWRCSRTYKGVCDRKNSTIRSIEVKKED